MAQARGGDTVKVHYTGRLEDGTVFDSSVDREPLQFTIGEGEIIPGFEQAVTGLNPGESRTVTVPADDAYGQHREELVLEVNRSQFPPDLSPEIGQQLQLRRADGKVALVAVSAISESTVTLDANHPLSGKNLTFDIELLEIV